MTDGNTIISLGSTGQAGGVSPSGDVVVGRDNAPVAWVRQSSGIYVKETFDVMRQLELPAADVAKIHHGNARRLMPGLRM